MPHFRLFLQVIFEIDVAPLSFSSYAIDVAKYEVRQNTARVSFSSNTAQSEANGYSKDVIKHYLNVLLLHQCVNFRVKLFLFSVADFFFA